VIFAMARAPSLARINAEIKHVRRREATCVDPEIGASSSRQARRAASVRPRHPVAKLRQIKTSGVFQTSAGCGKLRG
jgi:hypothetical protein